MIFGEEIIMMLEQIVIMFDQYFKTLIENYTIKSYI